MRIYYAKENTIIDSAVSQILCYRQKTTLFYFITTTQKFHPPLHCFTTFIKNPLLFICHYSNMKVLLDWMHTKFHNSIMYIFSLVLKYHCLQIKSGNYPFLFQWTNQSTPEHLQTCFDYNVVVSSKRLYFKNWHRVSLLTI